MKYSYKNNSDVTVVFRNLFWLPGDTLDTAFPVPPSLALTCTQEGKHPDPVLLHDDITVPAGQTAVVDIPEPRSSEFVSLRILDMSQNSGVECRFGSQENSPIPIDVRGFDYVIDWTLCSKLFFLNTTDNNAVISISVFDLGG